MVAVYVTLIINDKKKIGKVPSSIREQVKEMLIDLDLAYLAEE